MLTDQRLGGIKKGEVFAPLGCFRRRNLSRWNRHPVQIV